MVQKADIGNQSHLYTVHNIMPNMYNVNLNTCMGRVLERGFYIINITGQRVTAKYIHATQPVLCAAVQPYRGFPN